MGRWLSPKLCALTWKGWNGSPRSERRGGVAEWTKAAALKAVEGLVPSVGSNPTPSATPDLASPPFRSNKAGFSRPTLIFYRGVRLLFPVIFLHLWSPYVPFSIYL